MEASKLAELVEFELGQIDASLHVFSVQATSGRKFNIRVWPADDCGEPVGTGELFEISVKKVGK